MFARQQHLSQLKEQLSVFLTDLDISVELAFYRAFYNCIFNSHG